MPTQAKKTAKKKAPRKPAPKKAELAGPRPLTMLDYRFCMEYVQTGKQTDAFRVIRPDVKDPHRGAWAMMQRPEILAHIRLIYAEIHKRNQHAAEVAARASLLTLELADDRLTEILQGRRRSMGEMLTRDTKQLLIPGATMVIDEDGNAGGFSLSPEAQAQMSESSPVEDADLLKAVKLAYERKGGILKTEKAIEAGPVVRALYKPKWMQKTIEGTP